MAVGTTAAILGGAAIAGGAAKSITGAKQAKKARQAARNYQRRELRNVNEGRRISTLGSELAREEAARRNATSLEALRSGGVRGVVGGVGAVNEANIRQSRQIAADLDRQQMALDRDIARDEQRIQQMQEQRERDDLAALQGQVNAGNQQMFSGFGDIASGIGGIATGMTSANPTPNVNPTNPFAETEDFLNNYNNPFAG